MKLLDDIAKIFHNKTKSEIFFEEYENHTLEHKTEKDFRVHSGGSSKIKIIDYNTVCVHEIKQHNKYADQTCCMDYLKKLANEHGVILKYEEKDIQK
jgi:hypothetical protein